MSRYESYRGDDRYSDKSSLKGGRGFADRYSHGEDASVPQRFGSSRGGEFANQLGAGLRRIEWDMSKLPVFEKNFYIEHPDVASRSSAAAEDWRKAIGIIVVGGGVPKPVLSFDEASMPGEYL